MQKAPGTASHPEEPKNRFPIDIRMRSVSTVHPALDHLPRWARPLTRVDRRSSEQGPRCMSTPGMPLGAGLGCRRRLPLPLGDLALALLPPKEPLQERYGPRAHRAAEQDMRGPLAARAWWGGKWDRTLGTARRRHADHLRSCCCLAVRGSY